MPFALIFPSSASPTRYHAQDNLSFMITMHWCMYGPAKSKPTKPKKSQIRTPQNPKFSKSQHPKTPKPHKHKKLNL